MAINQVDIECMVGGNVDIKEVTFVERAVTDASAPCVVNDLEVEEKAVGVPTTENASTADSGSTHTIIMRQEQKTTNFTDTPLNLVRTPITEAKGWAKAPADAKEFTLLLSKGLISRPGLILKDENGTYTKLAIYKSQKSGRTHCRASGRYNDRQHC